MPLFCLIYRCFFWENWAGFLRPFEKFQQRFLNNQFICTQSPPIKEYDCPKHLSVVVFDPFPKCWGFGAQKTSRRDRNQINFWDPVPVVFFLKRQLVSFFWWNFASGVIHQDWGATLVNEHWQKPSQQGQKLHILPSSHGTCRSNQQRMVLC